MSTLEQLQSSLGGAYRLARELGGGGMSRVFLAEESRLQRKVAVKMPAAELDRDLTAAALFALQDDIIAQIVGAIAGSYGAISRT